MGPHLPVNAEVSGIVGVLRPILPIALVPIVIPLGWRARLFLSKVADYRIRLLLVGAVNTVHGTNGGQQAVEVVYTYRIPNLEDHYITGSSSIPPFSPACGWA